MVLEVGCDFLKWVVSGMRPCKKLTTNYLDDARDDVSEIGVTSNASNAAKFAFAIVDSANKLEDNLIGAIVVVAAVEFGGDGVELVTEVVEGALDWGGGSLGGIGVGPIPVGDCGGGIGIRSIPVRVWDRDGSGEGHSGGGDDGEDVREMHCEVVTKVENACLWWGMGCFEKAT
jgi:hypothetical protein